MHPHVYLKQAAKKAASIPRNLKQEYYLAAVGLRYDGAVVSSTNKTVRCAGISVKIPLSHAEVRLCRKLDTEATVFVARVNRTGKWALARPCENCLRRLLHQRVRRVYYTIGPEEYGCLTLKNNAHYSDSSNTDNANDSQDKNGYARCSGRDSEYR